MCGVLIEDTDEYKLKKIKVKDSKLLLREQREELYGKILKIIRSYKILIVNPKEIDYAVGKNDGLNLNWLEADKSAEILDGLNPEKAIIDAPGNNIQKYREYLQRKLKNKKINLILEHKADFNYPVVSAASILAKVTRDNEIEKIKKQIGVDFGSGYLSDPKTAGFLKNNFENYPEIFRKSWFPYQELVNKKFQKSLSEFTDFLKKEKRQHGHTIEDLKKLEDFGFKFHEPKSEHELAIMKGPCTVILYRNGKLLLQGNDEAKQNVMKLLGIKETAK